MSLGRDFLGPYRLVRLIRVGHSSQVWESIRQIDNRRVALKALLQEKRKDRESVASLRHEFELGQKFDHPNVIRMFEYNEELYTPFVAMEFFNFPNLKQQLRSSPELVARFLPNIVEQGAKGLAYVHDQGWIHRDVKPDNFLLSDDGTTKLIDFAIAQRIPRGFGRYFAKSRVQGTRSYMSPEQIRGEALDERADVYGFGCVLFELLTGRPPFTGVSPEELLQKHLKSPPPSPLVANKEIHAEFAALIQRMMAKRPQDRPANLKEFLATCQSIRAFAPRVERKT